MSGIPEPWEIAEAHYGVVLCEACEGSGRVPIGEHFVTRDMALDAESPETEGMSFGVEYGPCPECNGYGEIRADTEGGTE